MRVDRGGKARGRKGVRSRRYGRRFLNIVGNMEDYRSGKSGL